MKINTEFLEDHQVKVHVEIDPGPFDDAKQRAARRIAKKTKIPGFRPGKAPYPVVLRYIGEPAILEEAMEILIDDLYPKVIEEANITPYGPGILENVNVDPPTLEFRIPLSPTVELGDYRSIRVPYDFPGISDEEFKTTIDELRERQVIIEPVDRPAQEGDQVYIRLSAVRLNPKETQESELIKERDAQIIIKPEKSDETEYPFTGFSRYLIGLSAGDEKSFSYTYPEDHNYKDLIGVQAEFHIKVNEVKSRTLPELNDEFAQSFGEFSTYSELETAVKQSLEEQAKKDFNLEYDDKVLSEIVSISNIKYPPQMLEKEIDHAIRNLEERISQYRMDMDLYLKSRNLDISGLREELRPGTEARIKKSLVLMEIKEKEKIEVDQEELRTETSRTLAAIDQYMPKDKARKVTSDRESLSNLVNNIMFDMLTEKTAEKIRAIASGQEDLQAIEEPDQAGGETPIQENTPAPETAIEKPKRKQTKKKVEEE